MSGSFAATALWGLVVLAAFVGWGGAVAARLFPSRPATDSGLRAAWGMAFAILFGGTASIFGLATRGVIVVFILIGAGLALWYGIRGGVRGVEVGTVLAHWKQHPGSAMLLCICLGAALLQYIASIGNLRFNPNDDYIAYFPFAHQFLEQGTLFDPFSTRRVMSFGGHSFLHALVLAGSAGYRLHMLDQGVCLLVVVLLVLGTRTKGRSGLPSLLALIVLLTLPDIRINTYSELSGVAAFYGLYRTLVWLDENEGKTASRSNAVLVALVATAVCTLRSNYMAVAIPMVALSYAHLAWKDRSAWRPRVIEASIAAVCSAFFLAPWMWLSYRSSGTPLFPILRGNFNVAFPMLQRSSNWHDQISALIGTVTQHHLIPTFPLLFIAGVLFADRGRRRPLHTLLASGVIGWVLLVHTLASDVPSFERYVYGFLVAGALAVTTRISLRTESEGWRALVSRTAQAFAAAGALGQVVPQSADAISVHEQMLQRIAVLAPLEIRRPESTPEAQRYRALQSRVPVGQTLLVMVDYPFLFDFRRNAIYNIDTAAAVSPPPGFPYFRGPEAIATYLQGTSIRYLTFVHPRRSISLYRPDFWEAQRLDSAGFWHTQAPIYLDLFDNLEMLAASRAKLYDDGVLVLIDLSKRQPGAQQSSAK